MSKQTDKLLSMADPKAIALALGELDRVQEQYGMKYRRLMWASIVRDLYAAGFAAGHERATQTFLDEANRVARKAVKVA